MHRDSDLKKLAAEIEIGVFGGGEVYLKANFVVENHKLNDAAAGDKVGHVAHSQDIHRSKIGENFT
jgi:hypothetical protein